jgi:colicin import membrane protein
MLRFHYYGPVLLALAAVACQKSAQQEQSEAVNAQREANQTAREAADERIKTVTQANREASKDIASAQKEADDTARKAAADEAEKNADAQRKANAETREAVDATRKDQVDVQKTVEAKLNKLDERVRDLTKEANDTKVKPTVATSAKQQLSTAEAEIKSLRSELPRLQSGAATNTEQLRSATDQRVARIEKTLDQVDDQL